MRANAVAIVFLFVLTCLPFLPTLNAGFLNWDDDFYLTENPDIVSPLGWRNTLSRFSSDANVYPIVFATFRLEHRLWGFHPVGYHAVNVALHGLVTVSAFLLLVRLGLEKRVAWWASLLFAIHPIQVATVAWVSERKSLLGTLFILWAWIAYIRAHDSERDWRGSLRNALGLAFAALGYLSKSSLVVFPLLLLVAERLRKREFGIWGYLHLGLAAVLGGVYAGRETGPILPFSERAFLSARSFWYYAGRGFFPTPVATVPPKWDTSVLSEVNWAAVGGIVLLAGVLIRFRRKLAATEWIALALFLIPLAPSLGFLSFGYQQHAYVSDHFAYFAILGLSLFTVSALCRVPALNFETRTILLFAVAVVWTSISWSECSIWNSSESFWKSTLTRNPQSWAAHQNLATELDRQGRIEEALEHYREAVRIEPANPVGWINLGRSQIRCGSDEAALNSLNRAVEINPHYKETYGFQAEALSRLGRFEEALQAKRRAKGE